MVFACEKFKPYILGSRVIVHTDHAVIKCLMAKKDAKPRLIRLVLLMQEFNLEIKDKKGSDNVIVDHLSRIEKLTEEKKGLKLKKTSLQSNYFRYQFNYLGMLWYYATGTHLSIEKEVEN